MPNRHSELATEADERLVEEFVSRVRSLGWVESVPVEPQADGVPRIWTITSAPPIEFEHRSAVYPAELDASDAVPDARAGFRLVNLAELESTCAEVLPSVHWVAFERSHVA